MPRGAVYGFLGPNGSGKTTTIRMLLGLLRPDAGRIALLGIDVPGATGRVLPRVGALIEGPAFHPYISGRANLRRLDMLDATADPSTSDERVAGALARVGLTEAAGKRYRNYSLGMKQRLGLAAALLRPRDLLVLDEPTNGLDPQGTREIRRLIRELAARRDHRAGVEPPAQRGPAGRHPHRDDVGRAAAAAGHARGGPRHRHHHRRRHHPRHRPRLRRAAAAGDDTRRSPRAVDSITAPLGTRAEEDIAAALVGAGVRLRGLRVDQPDLEDLFVAVTGEGFDGVR